MPLPLPALLRRQLWDPGTGGACPPTPTHSPAHSSPHGHTGHGHRVYTSHPRSSARKEGSGDHTVHEHPKGCSSASCHLPTAPGQGCAPGMEGSRHLCVLGVQSLRNISGLAATAAPRGPSDPQCPTRDRRTHHGQTGPGRPLASRLSAPAHNLLQSPEQLSPILPRVVGTHHHTVLTAARPHIPQHRRQRRIPPAQSLRDTLGKPQGGMERGHQPSCFQGKTPSSSTSDMGHWGTHSRHPPTCRTPCDFPGAGTTGKVR